MLLYNTIRRYVACYCAADRLFVASRDQHRHEIYISRHKYITHYEHADTGGDGKSIALAGVICKVNAGAARFKCRCRKI